jgi:hypothetical protein
MTMSSKKNPSEDFAFPSPFLVFDAKGGEEDLYLCIIIVLIWCSSRYAYYVDMYLLLMDDAWKKE